MDLFPRTRRAAVAIALCVFLSSLVPRPDVAAGKGPPKGGGDVPSGVIYFYDGWSDLTFRINADGSNRTLLPLNAYGSLSDERHAGSYWFLQTRVIDGEFYPDGDPRRELFAVREDDGNDVFTVQLTNDPRLEITSANVNGDILNVEWASLNGVRDVLAVFSAIRWDWTTGTVIGAGIFEAPILYSDQNNVAGLLFAPDPSSPLVAVPVEPRDTDQDGLADDWRVGITGLDYAPDGSALAFTTSGNVALADSPNRLFVANLSPPNPVPVVIAPSASIGAPAWSNDGGRISFNAPDGIATVAPNGTSLQLPIPARFSRRSEVLVGYAAWSPDDEHLAYWQYSSNIQKLSSSADLFRATASGQDATNLSNDGNTDARPIGWRN